MAYSQLAKEMRRLDAPYRQVLSAHEGIDCGRHKAFRGVDRLLSSSILPGLERVSFEGVRSSGNWDADSDREIVHAAGSVGAINSNARRVYDALPGLSAELSCGMEKTDFSRLERRERKFRLLRRIIAIPAYACSAALMGAGFVTATAGLMGSGSDPFLLYSLSVSLASIMVVRVAENIMNPKASMLKNGVASLQEAIGEMRESLRSIIDTTAPFCRRH